MSRSQRLINHITCAARFQSQLRFVSVAVVVARPDLFLNIVFRTTCSTSIGNISTRSPQTAFAPVRWKSVSKKNMQRNRNNCPKVVHDNGTVPAGALSKVTCSSMGALEFTPCTTFLSVSVNSTSCGSEQDSTFRNSNTH